MNGIERIKHAFTTAHATHSAALMPYFTLGYPDKEKSVAAVRALAPYSDLMELGVPFSDPIADGPTVQRTTQKSLEAGTTVESCFEMVRDLRTAKVDTPFMLMGYYNPILAYGLTDYVSAAKDAGADGMIVPDLPPEEAEDLERACADHNLAYVHFIAPTSNPRRIEAIAERARGFIYVVSVAGVTGARSKISQGLEAFIETIKQKTDVPLAVGFGISTAEQAQKVGTFADGVIVGSAVLNAYDSGGAGETAQFVAGLKDGLIKR